VNTNGIALEATYNIYVGSIKANTTTKQRYRVRSANAEKRTALREPRADGNKESLFGRVKHS